jgi:hypothetical protein
LKSDTLGVGQPVSCAAIGKIRPNPFPLIPFSLIFFLRSSQASPLFPLSIVLGVGQPASASPPESLADVRGADARSAQICGRDSIAQSFQVIPYSGEPCPSSCARNLLPKDD